MSIRKTTKLLNRIRIEWELPNETHVFNEEKGEQPFVVAKDFTLSLHEKSSLRPFLNSWRGKTLTDEECNAFDVAVLLGKPCMLNVIHKESKNGKTSAQVASIAALPKGIACPPAINEPFEFGYDPFDQVKFDSMPDWLKDKIKTSNEYKALFAEKKEEPRKLGSLQPSTAFNDDPGPTEKSFIEDNQDLPF